MPNSLISVICETVKSAVYQILIAFGRDGQVEDENDDEDEDDLGSSNRNRPRTRPRPRLLDLRPREGWSLRLLCSEPGTKGGQQDVLPFESCIKAVTVDRMPRIRNRL